ncbi:hypothetical protein Sa4125_09060 [Aureimonas sp. SA4125]|uniref:hypothetical protein n=1 Tax=Aureimonas sp. SA4125 TaxID=2826993 RepID=UPI001CC5B4E0|nr:hypothetical protein [Aureimonas sp. SA4125]BDA83364.1 hypothetical protein Sa4125_09060 [Aureimonas sp. SA4125]
MTAEYRLAAVAIVSVLLATPVYAQTPDRTVDTTRRNQANYLIEQRGTREIQPEARQFDRALRLQQRLDARRPLGLEPNAGQTSRPANASDPRSDVVKTQ